jgi:hypothetical protein
MIPVDVYAYTFMASFLGLVIWNFWLLQKIRKIEGKTK